MLLDSIERALERPEACRDVLGITVSHFGADSGTLHLLGDDGCLHLKAATQGIPAPVLQVIQRIPVGKGMAGLAVERAEPVTACNLQTDTSGDVRPGAKATGMEGAIVVPVLAGNRAVGVLGIANRRERTFTLEETHLLTEIGRRIAAALVG